MTKSYYDALAPYYKFIYPDWDASVKRQAEALDSVIGEFIGNDSRTVLDAACGIGTQSIGLAKLGYKVTASDISIQEIEAAKLDAHRHGVSIQFQDADMRRVWEVHQQQFDVVIACDNAVPHLLSEDEILSAFREFYRCTKPGGGCMISVRDYAAMDREGHHKKMNPRLVHPTEDGQIVMFDIWDFYDEDHYEITTYLLKDTGDAEISTEAIRGGKYFCVEIPTLERLFENAGFRQVITLKERFFQPLIVAVR